MKNITITLDEQAAAWARVQAAEQNMSLSRYLGEVLRDKMRHSREYEKAMREALAEKPLELEGFGVIPPLSLTLPGFSAPTNYFGIFIPKGVPDEVIKTVQRIWDENISKSDALKKYATSRGALFAPASGEAAQKAVFPAIQANAWLLFEGGKASVSPDSVGIPKP